MSKQERIRKIKNLIGIFQREKNYFKVDRLKFLLKQTKKI